MSRTDFGSWQPVVDAAPGRAKDYYLAKFDLNSTLDVDQICRGKRRRSACRGSAIFSAGGSIVGRST